ncbi:MAG: serine hydrolase domain-containing protein [Haliea sp.]|uniref:serine hydrolase domain-containing protein n=1 Tax=Haliea sp. TaxID=1932666 RepID=UPI0032EE6B78
MTTKPGFHFLLLICVFMPAAGQLLASSDARASAPADSGNCIQSNLQTATDDSAGSELIVHSLAALYQVDTGKIWRAGSGYSSLGGGKAVRSDQQFRIASIVKTFAATLVMQLVEEGTLDLDMTLGQMFGDEVIDGVRTDELHVMNGKPRGSSVTLRQLLSHTTGMPDYIFADPPDGRPSLLSVLLGYMESGSVEDYIGSHRMNAESALRHFVEAGLAASPGFLPGRDYSYSETNYLLLRFLLEEVTGETLAVLYKERIFDPLGMKSTIVEGADTDTGSLDLVHQYWYFETVDGKYRNVDMTPAGRAIPLDYVSGTAGGMISNTEDLARFIGGLATGQLFNEQGTFKQMATMSEQSINSADSGSFHRLYGFGLTRVPTNRGGTLIGHCGFWGVCAFYDPESRVAIGAAINQAADRETFMGHYISALSGSYRSCEGHVDRE